MYFNESPGEELILSLCPTEHFLRLPPVIQVVTSVSASYVGVTSSGCGTSVRMWNLVVRCKGSTQTGGVWEQGAEGNIWNGGGGG
jgi:hypothetical protein